MHALRSKPIASSLQRPAREVADRDVDATPRGLPAPQQSTAAGKAWFSGGSAAAEGALRLAPSWTHLAIASISS